MNRKFMWAASLHVKFATFATFQMRIEELYEHGLILEKLQGSTY